MQSGEMDSTSFKDYLPEWIRPVARTAYHTVTGRRPRRLVEWRASRRERNPVSLNEHIRHKAAYDRRSILTTFADKAAVRDLVAATVGSSYLSMAHAIADQPDDVNWQSLPEEYVVKVTHGSGGVVIVTNEASLDLELPSVDSRPGWARYLVHPTRLDVAKLQDLIRYWQTLDYSWTPGSKIIEHCYSSIPPRILVEELLRDAAGSLPRDYKFFVIGGEVAFVQVDLDRFSQHERAIMSTSWDLLPVTIQYPAPEVPPAPPGNLQEMLVIATALGSLPEDFCRVDLYDLGECIVFGEITNFPGAGGETIEPASFDYMWGAMWPKDLPYGIRRRRDS